MWDQADPGAWQSREAADNHDSANCRLAQMQEVPINCDG